MFKHLFIVVSFYRFLRCESAPNGGNMYGFYNTSMSQWENFIFSIYLEITRGGSCLIIALHDGCLRCSAPRCMEMLG